MAKKAKAQGSEAQGTGAQGFALELLEDTFGISKRQSASWGKKLWRYTKIAFWMGVSAVVIPITMISLGLLLGPRGYEGLVAAPVAVFVSWALILFIGLRGKVNAKRLTRSSLSALPQKTSDYLEENRALLPSKARKEVDGILTQLEEIEPAVLMLPEDSSYETALRRLLTDDVTSLVEHYRRLPARLREKKLHGGPSPQEQLNSGFATIHRELERLHEEMAKDDLFSLATKERYLRTKYD